MGKVSRKKTKNIKTVFKQHLSTPLSKKKTPIRRSKRNIVKQTISFNESKYGIKTPNKYDNLSRNTVKLEDPASVITNDHLISVNNTTNDDYDHKSSQPSAPEVLTSFIKNDSIIDITDTTDNDDENKDSQSTLCTDLTCYIENDRITGITDISDDKNEFNKLQSVLSQVTIPKNTIDIIDTTNISTQKNVYNNLQTASSSYDNVQFINLFSNKKPIEVITLSDSSDEESTVNTPSLRKPDQFKSIKDRLGISAQSINIRKNKRYNSPLHHRKTAKMVENLSRQDLFQDRLGPFIIDKQRITDYHQHIKNVESKAKPVQTSEARRRLRPIIIDGLNIGHAHGGSGIFSAKGIDLCVQFFTGRGHTEVIAFIPQHRQGPPGSESNTLLNQLAKKGHICFTPSRMVQNFRMTCYDDRIILDYAHRCGGVVVSNDNFRDLYHESDAFKDIIENRQVMVTFVRDEIIVPDDQYNRRFNVRSLSDILCFPA